jgi:hypothetical protein
MREMHGGDMKNQTATFGSFGQKLLAIGVRMSLTATGLILGLTQPVLVQAKTDTSPAIQILLYNYVKASNSVVETAEHEAVRILHVADSQVRWVACAPTVEIREVCDVGWSKETPGVRLIGGADKFRSAEFGYASVPVLVTIYYEKVAHRAHQENADAELGIFLGALMAHELGHILLADPVHSATGIMQPEWGHRQFHQAMTGNLLFTGPQATRIQAQAHLLASLRPNTDSPLLLSSP